jgi:hypothetical protein
VMHWPTPTAGDARSSGSRIGNPDTQAHPGVTLTDVTCRSGRPAATSCTHGGGVPDEAQPALCGVAHGLPGRVARLRALGNAVVPQVAEVIGAVIVGALGATR